MQKINGKEDARLAPTLVLLAVGSAVVVVVVVLVDVVGLVLVRVVAEELEEGVVVVMIDEVLEVLEERLVEVLLDVWDLVDETEEEVTVESIPNRGE